MNFNFSSQADSDVYKTLGSLVKYNGGMFKSAKQANFVLCEKFSWAWSRPSELKTDDDRAKRARDARDYFAIPFDPLTQTVYMVSAWTSWADYGRKSKRPVSWVFVCDKFGVVAQYKLGFRAPGGNSASAPDPDKTKVLFERAADAVLPVGIYEEEEKRVAAAAAADAARTFVGKVGERREFKAKIVFVKEFYGRPMFYGDSGLRTMTTMEDMDGNKLVYWNNVGTKGETIRFKATVKAHEEYKGTKQTTLSRAKILESFGGGEDQTSDDEVACAA